MNPARFAQLAERLGRPDLRRLLEAVWELGYCYGMLRALRVLEGQRR